LITPDDKPVKPEEEVIIISEDEAARARTNTSHNTAATRDLPDPVHEPIDRPAAGIEARHDSNLNDGDIDWSATSDDGTDDTRATSSRQARTEAALDVVVTALGRGRTQREAAALAGISERTVRRYLDNPEVRARLSKEREAVIQQGFGAVANHFADAVETVARLLRSDEQRVQLQAARTLMSVVSEVRNVGYDQRLDVLEDLYNSLLNGNDEEMS
jgi:hypothetical protein